MTFNLDDVRHQVYTVYFAQAIRRQWADGSGVDEGLAASIHGDAVRAALIAVRACQASAKEASAGLDIAIANTERVEAIREYVHGMLSASQMDRSVAKVLQHVHGLLEGEPKP